MNENWLFHDDCTVERFCDSPDGVMICGSHDGREVYAVTHDLTPTEGWIMQFKVKMLWSQLHKYLYTSNIKMKKKF